MFCSCNSNFKHPHECFICAISKFPKIHSGNLSQIALPNMLLLVQISYQLVSDMVIRNCPLNLIHESNTIQYVIQGF